MRNVYKLDVSAMLDYARQWAFSRNPRYYDFEYLGGDCTNFISQIIYSGGAPMNYTPDVGWYYISLSDRATAWTGVEYFYNFIVQNRSYGPFGEQRPVYEAGVGDIIQLGGRGGFYHSLFVIDVKNGIPYITSHTSNTYNRPLTSYSYSKARLIRITGYRK